MNKQITNRAKVLVQAIDLSIDEAVVYKEIILQEQDFPSPPSASLQHNGNTVLLHDAELQPLLIHEPWFRLLQIQPRYSAFIFSIQAWSASVKPDLYQPALLSIQFPNHPTLFVSHKAEGTECIFSFFSVESQIEGFLCCLSASICNQKIRKTERKRERGGWRGEAEVGWSIIARSERNLCVWSRALCMSACQPGDFSSCVWKHACSLLHTRLRESVGVWQMLLDGNLAFMSLCVSN